MLSNPDFENCIQIPEIANIGKTNRAKFGSTAREWTKKYCG